MAGVMIPMRHFGKNKSGALSKTQIISQARNHAIAMAMCGKM
jgi:hypothetical protein